ncbi:MAG: DUF72 domain-containing protein [Candidatus Bathycorpusculaceae bacterium]
MKKYFEAFSLVELNSTFYQYPRMETVKGWREKAPDGFEFTVKAHQDISHKEKMKISDASLQAFERMKEICRVLNSRVLLIQTPGSFGPERLGDAEKFFKEVNREGLVLVWETRGEAWESGEVYGRLRRVLEEVNVTHVTDPFRVLPAYVGEIAYFRLHGLGERMYYYQFSDVELRRLGEIVKSYGDDGREVYVLFNNLAMFDDAVRFKEYLSKGVFPKIPSIDEVLGRVRYPVSKSVLMRRVGWRLVEVGRQGRLGGFLVGLPSKTYKSVEELLYEIKSIKRI